MKRPNGPVRVFLVLAALPPLVLVVLAMVGAREDVNVVMTGTGTHALLGAAWVAVWLAFVILSPIAVGAALVYSLASGLQSAGRH